MRFDQLLILTLPILFGFACINISINNTWKIPNTELEITIDQRKPSALGDEIEREMTLRDKHLDKTKIKLAKGMEIYGRVNIYRINENQYLLKDIFEAYELNTQTKTLNKTSPSTVAPTFIGAVDNNENGGWRYISASERAEIPLTTINEK